MPVHEWVEKIGRIVFESPFAGELSKDTPELAELRLALLDEVKAKSQRVSGRQVFPYNTVRVLIRGVPESNADVFTSPFLSQLLEGELRAGLAKARYRFPEDLRIELRTTPDFPVPPEGWLLVQAESTARSAQKSARRVARLVVLRGTANPSELVVQKARTNLGRTVDVHRSDGPSRRNDLAFTDDGDINRTVSREHAHVLYSKRTGEYRLFNDRVHKASNCGLWIIRDGLSQSVHNDLRGVGLKSGDEIQLGSAAVLFLLK
jgi:pSer/pThr/pTyr-binding forkhead associated (FHA) protein